MKLLVSFIECLAIAGSQQILLGLVIKPIEIWKRYVRLPSFGNEMLRTVFAVVANHRLGLIKILGRNTSTDDA